MPELARDLVALSGIGLVAGGCYLLAGAAVAMLATGALLIAVAVAGAWRRPPPGRPAVDPT
jgi:hypothetical protein